jgi:KUP system potassium uptake protein
MGVIGAASSSRSALTTVLLFLTMREIWRWSLPAAIVTAGVFVIVDLTFVSANMIKVLQGGWVPPVVAALVFFLTYTWWRGCRELLGVLERDTFPLRSFIA